MDRRTHPRLLDRLSPVASSPGDWPQLAHDAQRNNYTPLQIDPPYCYIWKWYEVSFASRAQLVVAAGRLFIGGMDGVLYARNTATGASPWTFPGDGSPIRHSAGVMSDTLVFSTHAGTTFALRMADGTLRWRRVTGSSATAPLLDAARGHVVVASTDGRLSHGSRVWEHQSERASFEGWYLPALYGLTPEIGLYLWEQTGGLAAAHVLSRETGDELRWWHLARAGVHAEEGESSYIPPGRLGVLPGPRLHPGRPSGEIALLARPPLGAR